MMLDQMIFEELQKIDLKAITVLSVTASFEGFRVVFDVASAMVEFTIDEAYRFQILSVRDKGKVYDDPQYLAGFENFVLDVMTKIKIIEMKKRPIYERMNESSLEQKEEKLLIQSRLRAVILREEEIKNQEQYLHQKELEIKKREQFLADKEAEIALKRHEEERKLTEKRLKNREKFVNPVKENTLGFVQRMKRMIQKIKKS